MPLQKVNSNRTTMSLDERFTQLRQGSTRRGGGGMRSRGGVTRLQAATAKNRNLAIQMARRPAVIAALNMRRGRGLTRNSLGTLSRGGLRGSRFARLNTVRGNPRIRRGQNFGRLSRSQSMQSLQFNNQVRGSGRGRGITRAAMARGRFNGRRSDGTLRRETGNNYTLRGSGGGGGLVRGRPRGRARASPVRRGNIVRGGGGRGGRMGRGAGRRLDSDFNNKPPSKETLDKELEQYMSSSKLVLDKEIDQYMNQSDNWSENWD